MAGYDELVDMTAVEHIAIPSTKRIPELAELAANMDTSNQSSKMAIVAPQDLAFGLGRMFEVYRNLHANSTKKVQVCRAMREACAFLGVKGESLTTSKVSGPKHDLAFRRRGELLHHRRILSLPRGWRETPRSHAQRPPTDRRLP